MTAEFSSDSDEVKAAAAFALGNVTAGNLPKFVPHLLSKLRDSHEYLMLHALKELIGSGQQQLSVYVQATAGGSGRQWVVVGGRGWPWVAAGGRRWPRVAVGGRG